MCTEGLKITNISISGWVCVEVNFKIFMSHSRLVVPTSILVRLRTRTCVLQSLILVGEW